VEIKTLCQFTQRYLLLDRLNGHLGLEGSTVLFLVFFILSKFNGFY
jgi:hypothetical protein